MPTLSIFFGIIIYMYRETDSRHNLPHIHAEYGEYEAVYDLDGNKLESELPRKTGRGLDRYSQRRSESQLEADIQRSAGFQNTAASVRIIKAEGTVSASHCIRRCANATA